jgi:hypothetical protein
MLRRSFVPAMALAVAAILSQPTNAQAGGIVGSIALAGFDVTQNGTDLSNSTVLTTGFELTSGKGVGDYSPIPLTTSYSGGVLDLSTLTMSSISNSTYGSFTPTSVEIVSRSADFLDVYVLGTYNPGSGLAAGLTPSLSSLRISFNFTGGSISEGMTLSTPPAAVSEPAGVIMGLTGVVACGLFFGVRRRSRKATT